MYSSYIYSYVYIYMYIYIYIQEEITLCGCTRMYVCMYVCMYVYMYVHIYIYTAHRVLAPSKPYIRRSAEEQSF